ncbi:MAG: thioredoxin family protein [Thiomicrorhabdus sp.]|nr:thioredoxin family protein [Thiomicrorhabdus sp.]
MNRKKLSIMAAVLFGLAFIVLGLKNLSRDVSLNDWESQATGYAKALQQQKQSGKPIVVLFYTDWCGSCKVLKADILSSLEVKAFIENDVLAVKINPERGADVAGLAKEFGVIGYPMVFVVLNKKDEIEIRWIRKTSRISPQQFIEQIQRSIL